MPKNASKLPGEDAKTKEKRYYTTKRHCITLFLTYLSEYSHEILYESVEYYLEPGSPQLHEYSIVLSRPILEFLKAKAGSPGTRTTDPIANVDTRGSKNKMAIQGNFYCVDAALWVKGGGDTYTVPT